MALSDDEVAALALAHMRAERAAIARLLETTSDESSRALQRARLAALDADIAARTPAA